MLCNGTCVLNGEYQGDYRLPMHAKEEGRYCSVDQINYVIVVTG